MASNAKAQRLCAVELPGSLMKRLEKAPEPLMYLLVGEVAVLVKALERWFQEFRRALSNISLETVELLQEALTPSAGGLLLGRASVRLQRLAGFSWWVEAVNTL